MNPKPNVTRLDKPTLQLFNHEIYILVQVIGKFTCDEDRVCEISQELASLSHSSRYNCRCCGCEYKLKQDCLIYSVCMVSLYFSPERTISDKQNSQVHS